MSTVWSPWTLLSRNGRLRSREQANTSLDLTIKVWRWLRAPMGTDDDSLNHVSCLTDTGHGILETSGVLYVRAGMLAVVRADRRERHSRTLFEFPLQHTVSHVAPASLPCARASAPGRPALSRDSRSLPSGVPCDFVTFPSLPIRHLLPSARYSWLPLNGVAVGNENETIHSSTCVSR